MIYVLVYENLLAVFAITFISHLVLWEVQHRLQGPGC